VSHGHLVVHAAHDACLLRGPGQREGPTVGPSEATQLAGCVAPTTAPSDQADAACAAPLPRVPDASAQVGTVIEEAAEHQHEVGHRHTHWDGVERDDAWVGDVLATAEIVLGSTLHLSRLLQS